MFDPYEDAILNKNKMEIKEEQKNNLKLFVESHENEKNKISENDQFHMLMQLVECAYKIEINKLKSYLESNAGKLYSDIQVGLMICPVGKPDNTQPGWGVSAME